MQTLTAVARFFMAAPDNAAPSPVPSRINPYEMRSIGADLTVAANRLSVVADLVDHADAQVKAAFGATVPATLESERLKARLMHLHRQRIRLANLHDEIQALSEDFRDWPLSAAPRSAIEESPAAQAPSPLRPTSTLFPYRTTA